jgi:tetratricopeptide (TPR) repeat protein
MDEHAAGSLLGFVEGARSEMSGPDSKAAIARHEERYGEVLAALAWSVELGRTGDALRIAVGLYPFWMATKRLAEGAAWSERVLEQPGADDALRGRACVSAAFLHFWQGDDERASALYDRALEIGRRVADPSIASLALGGLARVALRTNQVEEARRLCREAIEVTEGTDDVAGRSGAMHVLAVAAQMAGDFGEARAIMTARIALGRETGNLTVVSSEAGNLSMVERQLGNLGRAEELAREALEIDHRRRDHWAMPYKVSSLAANAAARGEHERAATLVGAAEAMMEAVGADWPPDERPHYERTVAALEAAMGAEAFAGARAAGAR